MRRKKVGIRGLDTDQVWFPSARGVDLPEDVQSFLVNGGMREEGPPFLSFGHGKYDFCPVEEIWGVHPRPETFTGCYAVGIAGDGSPICVHSPDGAVLLLDHDHGFQRVFVNSSPVTLSFFMKWFAEYRGYGGSRSLFDVETEMRAIDPEALQPGTFWYDVLTGECDSG